VIDRIQRSLLWIALALQALLLAPRLDLLPLWDDERYTLQTAARSPAGIVGAVEVDVHPPLYYLLVHLWLKLPIAGSDLVRARALSVLLALAATLLFDRLWLRQVPPLRRAAFLGLWVLSPCLLLYARMARSYTLQMLLAVVAIRMAQDWLHSPANRRLLARYAAAAVVLLYSHYLPGLAVVVSTAALGAWRGEWRRQLAALGLIAAAYLPWIGTLFRTAGMVQSSQPHWVGGNWIVENALKLGYAFVTFQFGETIPPWAALAGLALLPFLARALWKAWRSSSHPPILFLFLAAAGYFAAAAWVSFAFLGARLLFLLPFYYLFLLRGLDLGRPAGLVLYVALIAMAGGGLAAYHRRQHFLNNAYLVDFDSIASRIEEGSRGQPAAVLLDRFTSSAGYRLHGPSLRHLAIIYHDPERRQALDYVLDQRPALVWYLYSTRDSGFHRELSGRLSGDYTVLRHGFVPYSRWHRKAMEILRLDERPHYVVEVLEFRRR